MQEFLTALDCISIIPQLPLNDVSESHQSDKLISKNGLVESEPFVLKRSQSCCTPDSKRSAGLKNSQFQLYNEN